MREEQRELLIIEGGTIIKNGGFLHDNEYSMVSNGSHEWLDGEWGEKINDANRIKVLIEYICGKNDNIRKRRQLEPLKLITLKALLGNIENIIEHLIYDFTFNSKRHRVIKYINGALYDMYQRTRFESKYLYYKWKDFYSKKYQFININSVCIDAIKFYNTVDQYILTESQIKQFDEMLTADNIGKRLDVRYVDIPQLQQNQFVIHSQHDRCFSLWDSILTLRYLYRPYRLDQQLSIVQSQTPVLMPIMSKNQCNEELRPIESTNNCDRLCKPIAHLLPKKIAKYRNAAFRCPRRQRKKWYPSQ